jgi:hypothetical protein
MNHQTNLWRQQKRSRHDQHSTVQHTPRQAPAPIEGGMRVYVNRHVSRPNLSARCDVVRVAFAGPALLPVQAEAAGPGAGLSPIHTSGLRRHRRCDRRWCRHFGPLDHMTAAAICYQPDRWRADQRRQQRSAARRPRHRHHASRAFRCSTRPAPGCRTPAASRAMAAAARTTPSRRNTTSPGR